MSDNFEKEMNDLQQRLNRLKEPSEPTLEERVVKLNPSAKYLFAKPKVNPIYLQPKKTESEEIEDLLNECADDASLSRTSYENNEYINRLANLRGDDAPVESYEDMAKKKFKEDPREVHKRLKDIKPPGYSAKPDLGLIDFSDIEQPSEEDQINQIISQINDMEVSTDDEEDKSEEEDDERLRRLRKKVKKKAKLNSEEVKRKKVKKRLELLKKRRNEDKTKNKKEYMEKMKNTMEKQSKKKKKQKKKKSRKYDDSDESTTESDSDDVWVFI